MQSLPMYPHVTIHWRCSDNVFLMGLVPYRFVLSRIPTWARYIFIVTDTCYGAGKDDNQGKEKDPKRVVDGSTTLSNHHIPAETCLPNLKSVHRKNLFCLEVITELVSALNPVPLFSYTFHIAYVSSQSTVFTRIGLSYVWYSLISFQHPNLNAHKHSHATTGAIDSITNTYCYSSGA